MLQILTILKNHSCFSIKGGTAINLFYQDLPRLSVDIDLTYNLIEERLLFLSNIQKELESLKKSILTHIPNSKVFELRSNKNIGIKKLIVSNREAEVKIEPNFVFRGEVYKGGILSLCQNYQDEFLQDVEVQVASFPDVYAGKICAALDRQHPRDLFDVKILLDNHGITEEIRKAFVIYLASSARPMHELLRPNELNIERIYQNEFVGMTNEDIQLSELIEVRGKLVKMIHNCLLDGEKYFLMSMKSGNPNWSLLDIPEHVKELPAIRWKVKNIQAMDKKKHMESITKLEKALEI